MPRRRPLLRRALSALLLAWGTVTASGCTVECGAGQYRDENNRCVNACNSNADCVQGTVCDEGRCVPGSEGPPSTASSSSAATLSSSAAAASSASAATSSSSTAAASSGTSAVSSGGAATRSSAVSTNGSSATATSSTAATTSSGSTGNTSSDSPDAGAATDAGTPDAGPPEDAPWWHPNWTRRAPVTFDNAVGEEDLVDFPVLVRIDPEDPRFATADSQGRDLRFTAADGVTPIPHEVERWWNGSEGGANARSRIWVRAPTLARQSASNRVWMYWGNPGISDRSSVEVWSAGYQGVWHLEEDGRDSAPLRLFGDVAGTTLVNGKVGKARRTGGANGSYIGLPDDEPILRNTRHLALSMWARIDTLPNDDWDLLSIGAGGGCSGRSRATLMLSSIGNYAIGGRSADGDEFQVAYTPDATIPVDEWHHISGTIDLATATHTILVDGVLTPTVADTGTITYSQPATSNTNAPCSAIGADDNGEDAVPGIIDEVRIAAAPRSVAWLNAEYRSMLGAFSTIGPMESQDLPRTGSPPVAADNEVSFDEDRDVVILVLNNDSDPDGDPLLIDSVGPADKAVTFVMPDRRGVAYLPDPDATGADSFTYVVGDGVSGTDVGAVTVQLLPVNDAPVTVNDTLQLVEDTQASVDVLANDYDVEADGLSLESASAQGTVQIQVGVIIYSPKPDFFGTDTITYVVEDADGASSTGTVAVTVTNVNDAPTAQASQAVVPATGATNIQLVFADVDGDALTIVIDDPPTAGALTNVADGNTTVTYTPDPGFSGDTFRYHVKDANLASGTVTATLLPAE